MIRIAHSGCEAWHDTQNDSLTKELDIYIKQNYRTEGFELADFSMQ